MPLLLQRPPSSGEIHPDNRFYLSTDEALNAGDVLPGSTISRLAAGATSPASTPAPATYRVSSTSVGVVLS